MGTQIKTVRNSSSNWVQYDAESQVKNDLLFSTKDSDGNGYYAYVDSSTDTRLYVTKLTEGGAKTDGSNFCTIDSGSGDKIFLCLNRDFSSLYVGVLGEQEIHKFNTSDMVKGTSITGLSNDIENMMIDKNGILTVIGYDSGNTRTEVDAYDTNNSDTQTITASILTTKYFKAMYFTSENYLVVCDSAGGGDIYVYSESSGTYSPEFTIAVSGSAVITDCKVDIYNNLVFLNDNNEILKVKMASGSAVYTSTYFDSTVDLYGLTCDSDGNYYFSTVDSTGEWKKLYKYANDNDYSGWYEGLLLDPQNFSIIRNNVGNKCFNIDIIGYNVSGSGSTGR